MSTTTQHTTPKPLTRRKRALCIAMPDVLHSVHVAKVSQWPLLARHAGKARFAGCTDCIVHFINTIRTGCVHNCRRVRIDCNGLYVTYRGRRVVLGSDIYFDVVEKITEVY